jgi:hypothetical protein
MARKRKTSSIASSPPKNAKIQPQKKNLPETYESGIIGKNVANFFGKQRINQNTLSMVQNVPSNELFCL